MDLLPFSLSHLSSCLQAGSEGIHAATNLVLSSAVKLFFFSPALRTHFNLCISSCSLAVRLSRSFTRISHNCFHLCHMVPEKGSGTLCSWKPGWLNVCLGVQPGF